MGGAGVIRIGFDIGGSKLAAIAIDGSGRELARRRAPVPRDYGATRDLITQIATSLERAHGEAPAVGIGLPGRIGHDGAVLRAANLPWLDGRPLGAELEDRLGRPVHLANDADCFALSEASDGAAAGAAVVFGAILGTGVGGAIVIDGRPIVGANAIAGEWGHNPLPLAEAFGPAVRCGCGRVGCIETWLSGAALARDYRTVAGTHADAAAIARRAMAGDERAQAAIAHYARRLALALAGIVNLLDPDVIVLGGGLSAIPALYDEVPRLWAGHTIAPPQSTRLVAARFGPDSGLRGAARLGASSCRLSSTACRPDSG